MEMKYKASFSLKNNIKKSFKMTSAAPVSGVLTFIIPDHRVSLLLFLNLLSE